MTLIKVKRVYEPPAKDDGRRILVDRLWPRGIKREELRLESWAKEVAPSDDLRRWYHHEPARWEEFKKRYFAELRQHPAAWQALLEAAVAGVVTLLYAARDRERNNASALKEFLETEAGG